MPDSVPAALYVNANEAAVEGRTVQLDDGYTVIESQLRDPNGDPVEFERPNQVFTRWYGFSLTFPNPEIYDQ